MSKKIIVFLLLLLSFAMTAHAEKQEWIDRTYDFTKPQRVLVDIVVPQNLRNGIIENETAEIFLGKLKLEVIDKLPGKKLEFWTFADVMNDVDRIYGVNIRQMYATDFQKAHSLVTEYSQKNLDIAVVANLMVYDTGSQYQEGYFYTVPTTQTSTITNNRGGVATVTTHGTAQQYKAGRNVEVAYSCVKFEVSDMKTGKVVWTRIDDRAKANKGMFSNTEPKDLYMRIVGSYFSDLAKALQGPKK